MIKRNWSPGKNEMFWWVGKLIKTGAMACALLGVLLLFVGIARVRVTYQAFLIGDFGPVVAEAVILLAAVGLFGLGDRANRRLKGVTLMPGEREFSGSR